MASFIEHPLTCYNVDMLKALAHLSVQQRYKLIRETWTFQSRRCQQYTVITKGDVKSEDPISKLSHHKILYVDWKSLTKHICLT